jgi:hypothetical protein
VPKHLACLRDCRLVDFRTEGRQSYYSLTRPELVELLRSAELLLAETGDAVALCPVLRTAGAADGERVMTSAAVAPDRQAVLRRRIRLLVAATITYNVIEAVVALAAGTIASSVALIGFGLDSVIEVSSAAAVAWQFAGSDPQRRERVALRVIAWSFFALATYVTVEAVRGLLGAGEAEHSPVGIVLVAISVWSSCRSCPSHSAARGGNWDRRPPWRTRSRPSCAPTCPPPCSRAWS